MTDKTMQVAVIVFDGAEELDFVGPLEVFTFAKRHGLPYEPVLVAPQAGAVACAMGLNLTVDKGFGDVPSPDILLVPGGPGTRTLADDPAMAAYLAKAAATAKWVTGVCTGSLLLAAAGVTRNRRIATHWAARETVAARDPSATVVNDQRVVFDGNLVTAAGVSSGIDMALALLTEINGEDAAANVQKWMEYFPEPPQTEAARRARAETLAP